MSRDVIFGAAMVPWKFFGGEVVKMSIGWDIGHDFLEKLAWKPIQYNVPLACASDLPAGHPLGDIKPGKFYHVPRSRHVLSPRFCYEHDLNPARMGPREIKIWEHVQEQEQFYKEMRRQGSPCDELRFRLKQLMDDARRHTFKSTRFQQLENVMSPSNPNQTPGPMVDHQVDTLALARAHRQLAAMGEADPIMQAALKHLIDRVAGADADKEAAKKGAAFKAWTHKWLDEQGVPADPDPEENKRSGCRLGCRFKWLLDRHRGDLNTQIEFNRQLIEEKRKATEERHEFYRVMEKALEIISNSTGLKEEAEPQCRLRAEVLHTWITRLVDGQRNSMSYATEVAAASVDELRKSNLKIRDLQDKVVDQGNTIASQAKAMVEYTGQRDFLSGEVARLQRDKEQLQEEKARLANNIARLSTELNDSHKKMSDFRLRLRSVVND